MRFMYPQRKDFAILNLMGVYSKCNKGIENIEYSGGVQVTDKEWTVIDSIKDMDKISGLEEMTENI